MSRTKGAKDLKPRKRSAPKATNVVLLQPFRETRDKSLKEGITYIVDLAISKGMAADLWEMLNCFRRIKNL